MARNFIIIIATIVSLFTSSLGAQQGAGNILVSTQNVLREFTPGGTLVSAEVIPHPSGNPQGFGDVRDLVVHETGDIYICNAAQPPFLTVRRAATGQWQHFTTSPWHLAGNLSYGGIAIFGNYVFLPSLQLPLPFPGTMGGILRFDISTETFEHFPVAIPEGFLDLTIGWDGLLYAIKQTQQDVAVYDPDTMTLLRTITLPHALLARGIGVDRFGDLFVATWQQGLQHFDGDGNLIAAITTGSSHHDLDISPCGDILFGDSSGGVFRSHASLTPATSFYTGNTNTFVAFRTSNTPVAATASVRLGLPVNPSLLAGSGAILGTTWMPTMQPVLSGAFAKLLIIAAEPANISSAIGTYLFRPDAPYFISAFGVSDPMTMAIPNNCALTGIQFVAQGASVAPHTCELANALDVTISGF